MEKCRKRIENMLCVPNEKDKSKLTDQGYLESRSSASWEDITIPGYWKPIFWLNHKDSNPRFWDQLFKMSNCILRCEAMQKDGWNYVLCSKWKTHKPTDQGYLEWRSSASCEDTTISGYWKTTFWFNRKDSNPNFWDQIFVMSTCIQGCGGMQKEGFETMFSGWIWAL